MSRRLPLRYHRHWTTYHRKAAAQQKAAGREPGQQLRPRRGPPLDKWQLCGDRCAELVALGGIMGLVVWIIREWME